MSKVFLHTLVFIMSPLLLLKGQEISVSASFDTSAIYLGDQINFSVVIDQPADVSVTLPFLKDTLAKNIEILSGPEIDTAFIENGKIRITEKYLITSFDSGHYVVTPVYAEITDHAGIKRFFSGYSEIISRLVPDSRFPDSRLLRNHPFYFLLSTKVVYRVQIIKN